MLPVSLRRAKALGATGNTAYALSNEGLAVDAATLSRAPRQARIYTKLLEAGATGLTRADLEARDPGCGGAIRALIQKGLVQKKSHEIAVLPPLPTAALPALNDAQQTAVDTIDAKHGQFGAFVLDGVTGSGKTEVYLALAERAINRGLQVLLLVPEIGLTPQIIARVRQRLTATLVLLHSGLADGARASAWLAAAKGSGQVVLGTRSAIFTPLPRPGLIIVDEEHDLSYKQQDGLRYSARDLALVRAKVAAVPVVLGSATPSLETLWNIRQGRFNALKLTARAGGASLPTVELIDIRTRLMDGHLSPALLDAMHTTLKAGQQVLLFVNRRGFAPALLCHECGEVCECSRCDAKLVVHRASQRLRCHHCGLERLLPKHCPHCDSAHLRPVGLGTERLEDELINHFPGTNLARIDRDTTRRRGQLEASLEEARRGCTKILIGTQMLAKGHHFPGVTLVAILDADSGLFSADFRASERLAQLIVQVAGRAGRTKRPGRVLIQTHQPHHPLLVALRAGTYADFAAAALTEREAAMLPPLNALGLIRAEAPKADLAMDFLTAAKAVAQAAASTVSILGPVPAPMERRQGRFRAQLLLQSNSRPVLQRLLTTCIDNIAALREARKVRWSLDVDPQDMS